LNSQSKIVRVPYEEVYGPGFEDMFRRVPSLKKLELLVGYRPTTPLETIVDAVASDMRAHAIKAPAANRVGFSVPIPQSV
jgi:UDP-glucose 4-epimerase